MGVAITELLIKEETDLDFFTNKKIAIDASLFLYQFLSSIRQMDGTPLMDSKGNITSHLVGITSRVSKLMQKNIKVAFVFDGKAPELKKLEQMRRRELKKEAEAKYKIAVEKEDLADMKKFASRTSKLTSEMIKESKDLLEAFGIPCIQAPSEAEAQASYMVKKGDFYAVATQDSDVLMFQCPKLVRNLSIGGKKKKAGKLAYESIQPEIIDLSKNLNHLGIDHDQLIVLCMLVGTDYNIGGIKGIGPKKALDLVKKHKRDFGLLFSEARWDDYFDYPWKTVYDTIKDIPVTDDYLLQWRSPDSNRIKSLLLEREFSEERIDSILEKLEKQIVSSQQKGLGDFFKR